MNSDANWPTDEEERQLFSNLQAGVPTARNDIVVRYLPLLSQFLKGCFRGADADLCDTAAANAAFDFVRRATRFDPARGPLGAFLRMAARRDLLNLLERERRATRGIPLDSVAEPADRGNCVRDDEPAWDHPALAAGIAALDAGESAALDLMRDGTRDTAAFARRLGWGHLPVAEQAAKVKRVKDRVKKRLVRALEGRI